jgi:hypothetical protein
MRLGRRPEVQTTDFQDVAACFQPILLFGRERASNNQKQNTVAFSARSGGELKSKTE